MREDIFGRRSPAVFAGLLTAVGVTATLFAAPAVAFAEEVPGEVVQMGVEAGQPSTDLVDAPVDSQLGAAVSSDAMPGDVSFMIAEDSSETSGGTVDASVEGAESVEVSSPIEDVVSNEDVPETVDDEAGTVETDAVPVAGEGQEIDVPAEGESVDDVETGSLPNETGELGLLTQEGVAAEAEGSAELMSEDAEYSSGWNEVDGKWYWYDEGSTEAKTGWLVTDQAIPGGTSSGLQRYWLGEESGGGSLVTDLFSAVVNGVESWFFGTDEGYVVRGKWQDPETGLIYLADNDGVLAGGTSGGWVVSDAYGDGLQRYWIDPEKHAAAPGFSSDGYSHYTTDEGYVLRGKATVNDSESGKTLVYLADNDGLLAGGEEGGWVVSDAYGDGFQRYWIDPDAHAAIVGYSADGWEHYTLEEGYVLRGKYDNGFGMVYLADNDGRIPVSSGWVVTDEFDGEYQRYYIDENTHAARSGFFTVDGVGYFGIGGEGYVLRGALRWGNVMLLADNDAKLVTRPEGVVSVVSDGTTVSGSWLVTDVYSGELQRYIIVGVPGQDGFYGALVGEFSVGDDDYYGRDDTGYVVRGYYVAPNGTPYYADDDGKLDEYGWLTDVGRRLWDQIMYKTSGTQYLIAVDRINCRTVVFQGRVGAWKPIFDWSCTTGNPIYNGGDGTLKGDWQIGGPDWAYADHTWEPGDPYPTNRDNYRVENWVKSGAKYFTGFFYNLGFHSTVINYSDESQLGHRISHGCVRLLEQNAKWIFENCAIGTRVSVI